MANNGQEVTASDGRKALYTVEQEIKPEIKVLKKEIGDIQTQIRQGRLRGERGPQGERGPKGDKGDKGDKGERGPKGDQGTAINVDEVQSKHGFNTCIFLCATLLLNIIATWIIIYCPGYSGSVDLDTMPWFYIIPLVAIMLVNIATTAIWIGDFTYSADYGEWEVIAEVILLIFGTVSIWLFAFHPLEEITAATIALAVFLMFANVLAMIMRIIHFSYEYASADCDCDQASLAVSVIETLFLVIIFIIFVGWIRI